MATAPAPTDAEPAYYLEQVELDDDDDDDQYAYEEVEIDVDEDEEAADTDGDDEDLEQALQTLRSEKEGAPPPRRENRGRY